MGKVPGQGPSLWALEESLLKASSKGWISTAGRLQGEDRALLHGGRTLYWVCFSSPEREVIRCLKRSLL